MERFKKILSNSLDIFWIEFLVFGTVNMFVFANIFKDFIFKVFSITFLLGIITNIKFIKKLIEKYEKIILLIHLFLVIIFPITIYYNLPSYSYNEALRYIGEIKQKEGAKSFKYEDKKSSTIHGTNRKILTGRDYYVEAEVDGEYYDYYFNPYTGQLKEMHIIPDESFFKFLGKYKTLY